MLISFKFEIELSVLRFSISLNIIIETCCYDMCLHYIPYIRFLHSLVDFLTVLYAHE